MGMAPIGALLAGTLSYHLGAPTAVAICGAATICGAGLFGLHLPAFRQEARNLMMTQEALPGQPPAAVLSEGVTAAEK
jgi:hypothetical protein